MKFAPVLLLLLGILAAVAPAAAGAAEPTVQFLWAPGPPLGESGKGVGVCVRYLVWQRCDEGPETLVATTADTTIVLPVVPDVSMQVCVQGVDDEGNRTIRSDWSEPLRFAGEDGGLPDVDILRPNFPNPFNPETVVYYRVPEGLPAGAPLDLSVYTARGERVRTLAIETAPGWHQVSWDGRDERGAPSASGVYLSRFMAGAMVQTGKMVLAR